MKINNDLLRSAALFLASAAILLTGFMGIGRAADVDVLVDGNTKFACDLYGQLAESGKGKNLFFSPLSISTALGMTYAGARGQTAAEMVKALHFGLDPERLHPAFSQLLKGLNGRSGYELAVANSLWGQSGYRFLAEFLDITKTQYEGGLREVDFAGAPQPSRQIINRWVEEKTRDRIKELIGPDDITVETRLVLTNAIYFKGSWARKFEAKATRFAPFWLSDGGKVDTPMMAQKGTFRYQAQDFLEAVELPYAGDQVSMVIVLPRKGVGLGRVEAMLTPENLRQWLSRMPETKMEVIIPKFKLESSFHLNRALASLGMPDAFTLRADFSGMTGQKDLYITAAIHKAFVDVNEEGTEAAAATAIIMGTKAVMEEPPRFVADHPFIFAIVDKTTSSVLFLGRLMNPRT